MVDDGGDVTLLFTKATSWRKEAIGQRLNPPDKEEQVIKDLLLEIHRENPYRWHEIVKEWRGVSEETTTGVHRLYKMRRKIGCSFLRSTSTTRSPNRNSTISTAAGIRWSTD